MIKQKFYYHIDRRIITASKTEVIGWASFGNESIDRIVLLDKAKRELPQTFKDEDRADVAVIIGGNSKGTKLGFDISCSTKPHYLRLSQNGKNKDIRLTGGMIRLKEFIEQLKNNSNQYSMENFRRALAKQNPIDYSQYRQIQNKIREKALQEVADPQSISDIKFSILVPLYNTPVAFLDEMIESVQNQVYGKWELCLADGSDSEHLEMVQSEVRKYSEKDKRIRYKVLDKNGGISENTNEALKMATGDFIVLFDHDDLLTPDALYEFAKAIEADPECDCLYSDEDKTDETGKHFFDAHFKPDFSIDLLCSVNYICHLFAVRKELTDKYGGFRKEYDGSQDHDFILRMTEQARKTVHVPLVLYHWRVHSNSTAQDPRAKMYCFDAGKAAIRAHYERVWPDVKIDHIEDGISLGIYHTIWKYDEYPLVSVIIANKDHTEDLDKAIRSMQERNTWKNIEYIIVENNSELETTFQYYDQLQKEFSNVKVVRYEGDFNYSKINNFGVKFANGDYFLLMNNDVELIEPDSVREMIGYCQRDDVGVVGCRLLYDDGTIQHAGVTIGIQGIAEHAFKNQNSEQTYFSRAMIVQNFSAVTAAVMMVRRSVYEAVNGLDEQFAVAFNDVDFCLRIRKLGKQIVYNPYACFFHYESKSRGKEVTIRKQKRFASEIALFLNRYSTLLANGDPFYNRNLTLLKTDYSLRNIKYFRMNEQYFNDKEISEYINSK